MPICVALAKYGYSNFSLKILKYCEPSILLVKEKYYFSLLKPEYNISKDPSATMAGNKHSEDTILKMRLAKLNKKLSPETKAAISLSMPTSIKVQVFDLKTNQTTDYNTLTAAAQALDSKVQIIGTYLKRGQSKPYRGRYHIKKL